MKLHFAIFKQLFIRSHDFSATAHAPSLTNPSRLRLSKLMVTSEQVYCHGDQQIGSTGSTPPDSHILFLNSGIHFWIFLLKVKRRSEQEVICSVVIHGRTKWSMMFTLVVLRNYLLLIFTKVWEKLSYWRNERWLPLMFVKIHVSFPCSFLVNSKIILIFQYLTLSTSTYTTSFTPLDVL